MDPTDPPLSPVPREGATPEDSRDLASESAAEDGGALTVAGAAEDSGALAVATAAEDDALVVASGAAGASLEVSAVSEESAPVSASSLLPVERPSYLFFGCVTAVSLFADISTKVWAEIVINDRGFEPIKIIGENVSITLAYNQGGAWGIFATADEMIRKPFFLTVSAFAIFFIISLYSRLVPSQKALKWGLPLVLGGALGNLNDRITRSQVIDFIDYRADWVLTLNRFVNNRVTSWSLTDHWPTFNVADIAICIGVVLMGVDMFTHRPRTVGGPDEGAGPVVDATQAGPSSPTPSPTSTTAGPVSP